MQLWLHGDQTDAVMTVEPGHYTLEYTDENGETQPVSYTHLDILGVWIGEHENSKFWLNVLNDLKSRGVLDVYLFCTDGLCGMMQAIEAVFPKSRLQRCIVHQVRSSTRYVSYKDIKKVVADLKKIYGAVTLEEAEKNLQTFAETWRCLLYTSNFSFYRTCKRIH